jgi:hypothetical protein
MTIDDPRNPPWYDRGVHQQWDVAFEAWGPGALLGQALKYVLRAGRKPSSPILRDVRAAISYLQHLERKLVEGDAARESEENAKRTVVEAVGRFCAGLPPDPNDGHQHTFYSHLGGSVGICDICGKQMTRAEYETQSVVGSCPTGGGFVEGRGDKKGEGE